MSHLDVSHGHHHRNLTVTASGGIRLSSHNYGASIAAAVALASTAAAGTVTAISAEQQASYQSAVAANNAKVASINATTAIQQGQQQEQAKREQTAQLIGRERAAAGASNIDPNTGSPAKIQSDSAQLGELDALTIRNNAARQSWNFQNQSNAFAAESSQAETAGNLNAFSSLIGSASSVSSKWASYSNSGIFS